MCMSQVCLLERTRSNGILVQQRSQILGFKYWSLLREPGLLGETVDSSAGAGRVLDRPETANYAESNEVLTNKQINTRACQKDAGKSLQRSLLAPGKI